MSSVRTCSHPGPLNSLLYLYVCFVDKTASNCVLAPRPLAPGLLPEGVALCPPQQDVRFGVDTHTPCTVSLGFTWV